jgi:RTX calcium-binding nonapeptide repeat (4 copies)/Dockerin type I domain
MRMPINMWKKTLSALGMKVVERSNKSHPRRANKHFGFEALEPRQMLTGSPTIDSLSFDHSPVIQGNELTLTAVNPQDTGGTISDVSFYLETTPGSTSGGELLGTATSASGWSLGVSTATLPAGTQSFYAQAIDNTAAVSTPVTATDSILATPPEVTGVYVRGSAWTSPFLNYLASQGTGDSTLGFAIPTGSSSQTKTLPWTNLNEISVQFNQPVTVDTALADAELIGAAGEPAPPSLSSASFSFNTTTNTATWLLPSGTFLTDDKYILYIPSAAVVSTPSGQPLDGEFANNSTTLPSGNGTLGGDFAFDFNVLIGDIDRNGLVNANDNAAVRLKLGDATTSVNYVAFDDVDGSGLINASDYNKVKSLLGGVLPTAATVAPSIPAVSVMQGSGSYSQNLSTYFAADFPTGDTISYTVSGEPSGVTASFSGSTLSVGFPNTFAGAANLTITATDSSDSNRAISAPLALSVNPLATISGGATANEGSTYTLNLTQATGAAFSYWTINWGDGTASTIEGSDTIAQHVYAGGPSATPFSYNIAASGTNSAGTFAAGADVSVTVEPPPEVTGVYVDSTAWSSSFVSYLAGNNQSGLALGYELPTGANQLATLPWNNVNTISVQFNQAVTVNQATSLVELIESDGSTISLAATGTSFSFNNTTDVATWILPTGNVLTDNRYMLYIPPAAVTSNATGQILDGEFTNNSNVSIAGSSLPSGGGTPGGYFGFDFNVLPGDVNESNVVDSTDTGVVTSLQNYQTTTSGYSPLADIDGSGTIDATDLSFVSGIPSNTQLPFSTPSLSSGSASMGSFTTDSTHENWVVNYSIPSGTTTPPAGFTVAVYSTMDTSAFQPGAVIDPAVATPVASTTISSPLAAGSYSATLSPAFSDVQQNYYLVAVILAPDGTVLSSSGAFGGVYQDADGIVQVQGTDAATIAITQASGTLDVDYNGTNVTFPASGVTGIHVREHSGNQTLGADATVTENTWIFAANNDQVTGGAGSNYLVADGSGVTLTGGGSGDTYAFSPDASGSIAVHDVSDSSGNATLDFSQFISPVNVNIGLQSLQTIGSGSHGSLAITIASADGIGAVVGTPFADIITTNSVTDTLTGGGALALGTGTAAVGDTYVFSNPTSAVSDTIDDTSGTAKLDFSQLTPVSSSGAGVTVNLGSTSAQTVYNSGTGNSITLMLDSDAGIQKIVGTTGDDTLTGNALDNTLDGHGGTDTLSGGAGNDKLAGTAGSTFLGGTGSDSISYEDSAGTLLGEATIPSSGMYSDLVTTSDLAQGQLSATPSWTSTAGAGIGGGYLSVAPPTTGSGTGSNALNWSFGNLASGTYQVYVTFPASSANTTAADFTISDGATAVGSQTVNEQITPSDLTIGTTAFASLGSFEIDSGTLNVNLSDLGLAGGNLAAGSVYIVQTGTNSLTPAIPIASATSLGGNTYTFTGVAYNAALVDFYLDTNQDGVVDAGDTEIAVVVPDSNGNFSLTTVLPAGYSPQNVLEIAVNQGNGQNIGGVGGGQAIVSAPVTPLMPPVAGPAAGAGAVTGGLPTFDFQANPNRNVPITVALDDTGSFAVANSPGAPPDISAATPQSYNSGPGLVQASGFISNQVSAAGSNVVGGTGETSSNGYITIDGGAVPIDFSQPAISQSVASNFYVTSTTAGAPVDDGSQVGTLTATINGSENWTIGSFGGVGADGRPALMPAGTLVLVTTTITVGGGSLASSAGSASTRGVLSAGAALASNGNVFNQEGESGEGAGSSITLAGRENDGGGTFGDSATVSFLAVVGQTVTLSFNAQVTAIAGSTTDGSATAIGQIIMSSYATVQSI